MVITEALERATRRECIGYEAARAVMDEIMSGAASDIQMAAYLTAMAVKGETIEEITGSAAGMRAHCVRLLHDMDVLEVVGTGGDMAFTFNISSTSSLVISAAGTPVAKHGNRAATSRCGAADLFEELGVNILAPPERSLAVLKEIGLCFLFAQNYHIAMRYVAPVRRELKIRTMFNILGPLVNPAGARRELLGVYEEDLVEPLAHVLAKLGVSDALVVHGHDGIDELSLSAPTTVCEARDGTFKSYVITPEDLGLARCKKSDLAGGSPQENATITRAVLAGERGAQRDAVVLNSAAALYVAHPEIPLADCARMAEQTIDSGAAMRQLERFIALSHKQGEGEGRP
ncbi:MAG: anthranilate phosphoribosyltransferase [Coriobacteriales bacterium]|jgi:anthranilate phosphoribosyltransferase|nr:anthranilate phosphoribosyltransferase [Coriobacteriales bacterium]